MSVKHYDIWRAIDLLAETKGLSPSGLAKIAGLDPTSFNMSKRATTDGRPRWPSTETLAKIFNVTGEDFNRLPNYISGDLESADEKKRGDAEGRIPLIGYAQAGQEGYFDDAGYPTGQGWDMIPFPPHTDPNLYALEVSGNSMEPLYREGDVMIVSPQASNIRRGDRVIVRTKDGQVMAKQLQRQTANQIVLKSLNDSFDDIVLSPQAVQWLARILWVSQ